MDGFSMGQWIEYIHNEKNLLVMDIFSMGQWIEYINNEENTYYERMGQYFDHSSSTIFVIAL
jgi:hypothetical protein